MLITLIVLLIIVGVVLYCVNLLPIDPTFKKIIWAVAVLFAVLYVLKAFGLLSGLPAI